MVPGRSAWTCDDLRPNLAATLVVDAGGDRVRFPVIIHEATLSYFDLVSPDVSPLGAPARAHLFVEVSVGTGVDRVGRAEWYFDSQATIYAASLQVAGRPVAASLGPPAASPGGRHRRPFRRAARLRGSRVVFSLLSALLTSHDGFVGHRETRRNRFPPPLQLQGRNLT